MKPRSPGAATPRTLPSDIIEHSSDGVSQRPETSRLIRLPEVIALCGLARSTIYRDIRNGVFPAPVKLGRLSVWLEHEVHQWIEDRIEESRAA
ncbi:helix-turn-helix transcriptional regulator [Roseovarius sp. SYSU LYC5161]|uniref:helix-turn-helix transcriptional regulator n=1 Tax=Roseovarius halophilus (ex Wu et al. 2025) TaxID=3376060 RepID=UPI00399C3E23